MTGGCSTAVAVAAGGSCLLGEMFVPAAGSTGQVIGSLAVTSNSLDMAGSENYAVLTGNVTAEVISVEVVGATVAAGVGSATLSVNVGYTGTAADMGAITVTVNGSSSGVGTPTCSLKPSHEDCTYPYTGTALATMGSYPIAVSVAASGSFLAGTGSATLTVTGSSGSVRQPLHPLAATGRR
jgi:hypothetical protein